MNRNWDLIGDKIFGILRGRGYRTQMFDKGGSKTMDPHEATRFFSTIPSHDPQLQSFNILVSVHDDDASSHMDIKTPNLADDRDFNLVIQLKNSLQTNVGDRENISVNWYKFDHDIDPREDAVNNIRESRDISKPYGSTKSSYQQIGNSRLIIRHTDPVNEDKRGSRWRRVKHIFIENHHGERFKYPLAHIAGARAMARHLANNGVFSDRTGCAIVKMSEDYLDLKRAARHMQRSKDGDLSLKVKGALEQLGKRSKQLSGIRGYAQALEQMANQITNAPADRVIELRNQLAEACGCEKSDDVGMRALTTAARYLLSRVQDAAEADSDITADLLRLEALAGII